MRKGLFLVFVLMMLLYSACGAGGENKSMLDSSESNIDNLATESEEQADVEEKDDSPETDGVGVIRAAVSRNCNYIYHMLAVSECGYVNEYGSTYRYLHSEEDLQILKNNERYLTIKGGEYQGDLNFLFMILPVSLDDEIPLTTYFDALADLFGTGEVARNFESYQGIYERTFSSVTEVTHDSHQAFYSQYEHLKEEIAEIATVMSRNYSIYTDEVWETSLEELAIAAAELNQIFAEKAFASKWEQVLDHEYRYDAFYVLLCNSMDNGPDCIDVSHNKDVFNARREYDATAQRVSHEFGIYILMDILADLEFQGYDYWGLKEGLAEYYNIIVSGGFPNWSGGEEYITFYTQLREDNPAITAKEMFLQAVDFYMIDPDL